MQAEDDCVARGGHLASIHGPHDTEVLNQIVPDGVSAWIGFHDRDQEFAKSSYTHFSCGTSEGFACRQTSARAQNFGGVKNVHFSSS